MPKLTRIQLEKTEKLFKAISIMAARDKNISYKARGILFYLLSKPDGWKGHIYDIVSNSDKDGISSVKSALKELVDAGYASLKTDPQKDGTFNGKYYEISEFPHKK